MGATTKVKEKAAAPKKGSPVRHQADPKAVLVVIGRAKGRATTRAIADSLGTKDIRAVGNTVRALIRQGKVVKAGGVRGPTVTYAKAPQAAA